jgi:hypothetical protein
VAVVTDEATIVASASDTVYRDRDGAQGIVRDVLTSGELDVTFPGGAGSVRTLGELATEGFEVIPAAGVAEMVSAAVAPALPVACPHCGSEQTWHRTFCPFGKNAVAWDVVKAAHEGHAVDAGVGYTFCQTCGVHLGTPGAPMPEAARDWRAVRAASLAHEEALGAVVDAAFPDPVEEIGNLSQGAIELLGELMFLDLRARGYDITASMSAAAMSKPVRSKLARRARKAAKRHAFAGRR